MMSWPCCSSYSTHPSSMLSHLTVLLLTKTPNWHRERQNGHKTTTCDPSGFVASVGGVGNFDVYMGSFPHCLFPGCRHLELQTLAIDWYHFILESFQFILDLFQWTKTVRLPWVWVLKHFPLLVSVCHHLSKGFKPPLLLTLLYLTHVRYLRHFHL